MLRYITTFFATFMLSNAAYPCTFIQLGNAQDHANAQNFDFPLGLSAGIVINQRNVEKSAGYFANMPKHASPAKWVSKYGSVTFGFGREVVVSGVNETGLSVYRLALGTVKYLPDHRPAMHENQFLQYLLDTSATMDEVIQQANAIQVYAGPYPTHFAVCDQEAKCAVIEAVAGKFHIYSDSALAVAAITNTEYPKALELLAKCPNADCQGMTNSQWRFVKAASQVKDFSGTNFMNGVFEILDSVKETFPAEQTPTLWTLLTHETGTQSQFLVKNTKSSKIILSLDYKKLNYSCKHPVQVALLRSNDSGDSVVFSDYTKSFQEGLATEIGKIIRLPDSEIQAIVEYPDKYTHCLD